MGEVDTGGSASGAIRRESGTAASLGAGDRLSLAATPTFAAMALLTAASGGSDMLCMAAQDTSPLSGMVSMYMLMSAFHSAPWLTMIAGRPDSARAFTPKPRRKHTGGDCRRAARHTA